MRKNSGVYIKRQKGAVLFISLIFLLIMTVLGLSSLQDSIMQEKMTAAVRDGRVALEGAEAALHYVEEDVIEELVTTGAFDNSGCLYDINSAPRQDVSGEWPDGFWSGNGTCEVSGVNARGSSVVGGSDGSLAEVPRYYAELSGTLENEAPTSGMIFNYNEDAGGGEVTGIKIFVRSVGSSDTTQKIIQGYYGKRF